MKESKNIELEDLNSMEETIKFIFQIKEKDVFDNEYETLAEEVKEKSYKKIKPLILSNFISSKINDLNENYSYSKKFLKFSNDNFKIDLSHLIDIDQFKNTRNLMSDKLKCSLNMSKNSIKEDLEKLSFLGKKKNREDDGKEDSFDFTDISNRDNLENEQKNDNNNNNINCDNKVSSKLANNNSSNFAESYNKSIETSFDYNLKIFYFDGNDSVPQMLKIEMNDMMNYENFIYLLKKKLGIYEYAKFKLVSVKNNKGK